MENKDKKLLELNEERKMYNFNNLKKITEIENLEENFESWILGKFNFTEDNEIDEKIYDFVTLLREVVESDNLDKVEFISDLVEVLFGISLEELFEELSESSDSFDKEEVDDYC